MGGKMTLAEWIGKVNEILGKELPGGPEISPEYHTFMVPVPEVVNGGGFALVGWRMGDRDPDTGKYSLVPQDPGTGSPHVYAGDERTEKTLRDLAEYGETDGEADFTSLAVSVHGFQYQCLELYLAHIRRTPWHPQDGAPGSRIVWTTVQGREVVALVPPGAEPDDIRLCRYWRGQEGNRWNDGILRAMATGLAYHENPRRMGSGSFDAGEMFFQQLARAAA